MHRKSGCDNKFPGLEYISTHNRRRLPCRDEPGKIIAIGTGKKWKAAEDLEEGRKETALVSAQIMYILEIN